MIDENYEIYKLVLEKIQTNGVSVLKNKRGAGSIFVWQLGRINNTQLVLSYEYRRNEYGNIVPKQLSVGHMVPDTRTGGERYKPVAWFDVYSEQHTMLTAILKSLSDNRTENKKLALIRALAENKYQK